MRITSHFVAVALLVPANSFVPLQSRRTITTNQIFSLRASKLEKDNLLKYDNTLETPKTIELDGSSMTPEIDAMLQSDEVDGLSPLLGTLLTCSVTVVFLFITLLQSNNINDTFLDMGLMEKASVLSQFIPGQFDRCEVYVATILGFAAFAQSLAGFGFAIVAVGALSSLPWLLHSEVYEVVTPIVATLGSLVGFILLLPNAKKLEWGEILPLAIPCAVFTPVGIYLSTIIDTALGTKVLAVLVLAFVGYQFLGGDKEPPKALSSTPAAYLLGTASGIFGGAFDIQGPPLVVYGNAKGWEPRQFRSNILAVVALNSLLIVVLDYFNGRLVDFHYADFCLTALPVVLIGVAAGDKVSNIIDPVQFKKFVLGMCFVLGIRLLTLS